MPRGAGPSRGISSLLSGWHHAEMARPAAKSGERSRLQRGRSGRSPVKEACLQDDDVVAVDEVDEAVLLADTAGPGAGEHMPERFGLTDARDRVAEGSWINRLMRLSVARSAASQ